MGAGRVIAVGAPETPRLKLAREFGAEATVDIEKYRSADERIKAVRDIVGGYGADLVMDCSGHPTAGPEGIEFLRDGGTYVEIRPNALLRYTDQFDDAQLPGQMQVTVSFTAVACGTALEIVQEGIPDAIPLEFCHLGWQESLTLLALLVEAEIKDGA